MIDAIKDYQNAIEHGLALFDAQYGRRDILAAWREKVIPKSGVLRDGVEYELHGIGCCFHFSDFEVDFDFAPNGRADGFDLWRLGKYVRQFPSRYPDGQDKNLLAIAFDDLVSKGVMIQRFPNDTPLWFLCS